MRLSLFCRIHLKRFIVFSTTQDSRFSTSAFPVVLPTYSPPSSRKRRPKRHKFAKLLQDVFLANIILHSYWKSGAVHDARTLFDKMPERNLISWSSVVSMYAQNGYSDEAWSSFIECRRKFGDKLNEYILASVIRACTEWIVDYRGAQLHCFVVKTGFDKDVYVGTSLIDFYAKNCRMGEARWIFDDLVVKSSVTWTTIITGYSKSGNCEVSLQLFRKMGESDVTPDKYVLTSVLSACAMLQFVECGKQIHAYVLRREADMDLSVTNVLIDLYVKCGKVRTGRKLFDQIDDKNVITWTTMISGYMQHSYDWEAISLFGEMARLGWTPDGYACSSVLTSCGSLEALGQGRVVHACTIKANLEYDDFVKTGLIDMYAKCNSLQDARKVFDLWTDRNVVSYNAMIEGYTRNEELLEALNIFHEMRLGFFSPSLLSFVSLLGVSAALVCLELSKQIHGLTIKYGFSLEKFAGSALIDVYSKCSCTRDARTVFEEIKEKDIVVWNALIFGCSQSLESEQALRLYSDLQLSSETPNEYTFAALFTAASNLASLQNGQQFHGQLLKLGLECDPFVTNALVDMYAKCGSMGEAENLFNSTSWKDVVCWNSMMSTYAHHGEAEQALGMFEEMAERGIKPNYVTFVGVLSACSHAGFLEAGFRYFASMARFGVEPGMEHYACIVSLLGRAGKLVEAIDFIGKMPIKPAAIVWRSLLSACRAAGNLELGIYAAERAVSLDPMDSGSYILLSNILASKGKWVDVKRLRERMDSNGVIKERGQSWIELSNKTHVFVSRDTSHRDADLIYSILDDVILHMKTAGYVPGKTIHQTDD